MSSLIYLLNGVDGNSLVQGIFSKENNELLKFGIGGKYLGSGPFAYKHSRLREIDLVSLINVDNSLEVAYSLNKVFKKSIVGTDIYDIIKWCSNHPSLVFIGNRNMTYNDSKGSVDYDQYFFGFTQGYLNENQLREVMKING